MKSTSSPRKASQRNSAAVAQRATAGPEGGSIAPPNRTGLPDRLKAGVERLSGLSLDDVRVHYNSSKPAQLQALAYTQGADIHVAPEQERHLPHEAWHVVQQKQGRVKPTFQTKGASINDDPGLEHDADVMAKMALQRKESQYGHRAFDHILDATPAVHSGRVTQLRRIKLKNDKTIDTEDYTKDELHEMFVAHIQTHLAIAEQLDAAIDDKEFHENWLRQRSDPYNTTHPNWLPPIPPELSGVALNPYMRAHGDVYPTVELFTGDMLSHFTTREGASGISSSKMMYPSVVAGMQTTHYGRGVYFTGLGKDQLQSMTHGDVTRAIYTRDSAENRRRSEFVVLVDVSDILVFKYQLTGKAPVFMHPTTEPIDVQGKIEIIKTSALVMPDTPPSMPPSSSKQQKPKKPPKPPSAPNRYPRVVDWDVAYRDYETAQWINPETYGNMSFDDFLKDYRQEM